jgi:hypothetical protein
MVGGAYVSVFYWPSIRDAWRRHANKSEVPAEDAQNVHSDEVSLEKQNEVVRAALAAASLLDIDAAAAGGRLNNNNEPAVLSGDDGDALNAGCRFSKSAVDAFIASAKHVQLEGANSSSSSAASAVAAAFARRALRCVRERYLKPAQQNLVGAASMVLRAVLRRSQVSSTDGVSDRTFFVGLASFRDVFCRGTLVDMFARATNPQRIFVGVVEQNEHADFPCVPPFTARRDDATNDAQTSSTSWQTFEGIVQNSPWPGAPRQQSKLFAEADDTATADALDGRNCFARLSRRASPMPLESRLAHEDALIRHIVESNRLMRMRRQQGQQQQDGNSPSTTPRGESDDSVDGAAEDLSATSSVFVQPGAAMEPLPVMLETLYALTRGTAFAAAAGPSDLEMRLKHHSSVLSGHVVFCPADNIRRRRVPAAAARGPTYGRYISQLMYRGEAYFVMLDAHNLFATGWDARIGRMLRQASLQSQFGRAIVSHYPLHIDARDFEDPPLDEVDRCKTAVHMGIDLMMARQTDNHGASASSSALQGVELQLEPAGAASTRTGLIDVLTDAALTATDTSLQASSLDDFAQVYASGGAARDRARTEETQFTTLARDAPSLLKRALLESMIGSALDRLEPAQLNLSCSEGFVRTLATLRAALDVVVTNETRRGKLMQYSQRRITQPYGTVMCRAHFLDPKSFGYVRMGGLNFPISPTPRPQPFTAAGFLAADARLLHEVRFDPLLDYLFDGEELLYTVRAWTHGWDFFAPSRSVVYHHYERHNGPRYWDTAGRVDADGFWNAYEAQNEARERRRRELERVGGNTSTPSVVGEHPHSCGTWPYDARRGFSYSADGEAARNTTEGRVVLLEDDTRGGRGPYVSSPRRQQHGKRLQWFYRQALSIKRVQWLLKVPKERNAQAVELFVPPTDPLAAPDAGVVTAFTSDECFGLGRRRSLEAYWKFAKLDLLVKKDSAGWCPDVR